MCPGQKTLPTKGENVKGQRVRLPHPNGPQGSRHRFSKKGPDVAGRRKGSRHTVPDKTPNLPPRSPEEDSARPPQTGQVAPHPLWPPATRLTACQPTPPSQRTRVEGRRGLQFPRPGQARTPSSNPKGLSEVVRGARTVPQVALRARPSQGQLRLAFRRANRSV